jgi:glucose-1-phosphate adenylyltransferase
MMGADFYEAAEDIQVNIDSNLPHVGIGESCELHQTIIDKNARIGNNCRLINKDNVQEADGDFFYIREGIVIIPKNAVVPSGTEI